MSSQQRTLSGLTVGAFDELSVDDDIALHGALKAGAIQTTGAITCEELTTTGGADIGGDLVVEGEVNVEGGVNVDGEVVCGALDAGAGTIQTTGTVSAGTLSGQTLSGLTLSTTAVNCTNVNVGNKTTIASDGALSVGQGAATISAAGEAVLNSLSFGGVAGITSAGNITAGSIVASSLDTGTGSISCNSVSVNYGVVAVSQLGSVDLRSLVVRDNVNNGANLTLAQTGDVTCSAISCSSLSAGSGTIETTGAIQADSISLTNASLTSAGHVTAVSAAFSSSVTSQVLNLTYLNVNSNAARINSLGQFSGSAATFTGLTTTGTLALDSSSPTFTASYPGATVACTNLNLLSTSNKVLPTGVYLISGHYFLALNSGGWRPNDDSTYYNIHIEDDTANNKVFGRAKAATTGLEMVQIVQIPQGWRATGVMVEIRDVSGSALSRNLNAYKIYNYTGVGFTSLGSGTSLNEISLGTTLDGDPYSALMIVAHVTTTTDHVGGGYVRLSSI